MHLHLMTEPLPASLLLSTKKVESQKVFNISWGGGGVTDGNVHRSVVVKKYSELKRF